ncbi:FAD-dependent oxidoreductase [Aerosakkonema sp. BLCC-F183]|uniref:FAD-dependent oxidoreductase n=1 Tax=Aerosakkonema sp. BLCC-F183 TaxID=3342834 RepID=UPI0035BA6B90
MVKKVVIVGAGPSGLLLAHYLLRRGDKYQIDIYERRSDPRIIPFSKSRTFPITLSERGMSALSKIEGLAEAVRAISVEMLGAVSHQKNGKQRFLRRRKPLFALDRTSLTIVLLQKLTEKYDNSRFNIRFDSKCSAVNFEAKTVTFQNIAETAPEGGEFTVYYDLLIGADGASSVVREHFTNTEMFELEQQYVRSDYKSIFLPRPDENLDSKLKPGYIHSWRLDDGSALLLLHQQDGMMSGVIHFPRDKNKIVRLSSKEDVRQFFRDNFPAIAQKMSDSEAEDFLSRPISTVLTIRCNRYHYGDSVVLIGDAAHSVSPSLGQGCNSALEDAVILGRLFDEYSDNLAKVTEQFTMRRKPDAHALVELSDNAFPLSGRLFVEYILREIFAKFMHKLFPNVFPPSMMQLISETTESYGKILNLHKSWVEKVKKSNKKFIENL